MSAEVSATDHPLVGSIVGERYRVTRLIGIGGMGSVFAAQHIHMRKQVALKVLHGEMTALPEIVARFEREAVAAGRIDHPNVAQATDFGRLEDGSFYLVLEYVEGQTLAQLVEAGRLPLNEALAIAAQVADALAAAHAADIVHRDLKPDNVMLVERVGGRQVKVLDFGIAKLTTGEVAEGQLTTGGTVFGTPEYMAPEQAAGQKIDHRADLYALGLLMYYLLEDEPPFSGEDVSKVLLQQITTPPPELSAAVPESVRDVVMSLLEKEPSARLATAELAAERIRACIEQSMQDESESAAPQRSRRSFSERARALFFGLRQSAQWVVRASRSSAKAVRAASVWLDNSPAGRPLTIAKRKVPIWRAVGAGIVALSVMAVLVLWSTADHEDSAPAGPKASRGSGHSGPALSKAQLDKLMLDAIAGDPAAIQRLEQRDADERSAREWLALARGFNKLKRWQNALDAYQQALGLEPSIAANPEVATFLFQAAQQPEVANKALTVASEHLGARGADLLYKVWVDLTRESTPITRRAKELVYTEPLFSKVSPALKVALELRRTAECSEYEKLLPQVSLHGDRRSLRLLKRLKLDKGCELPEEALNAAIAAVKDRPEPRL